MKTSVIDQRWVSEYPNHEDDFLKMDKLMHSLESMRKKSISFKGYRGIKKDGQILHLYMQYVLNRSTELLKTIFSAWNKETPAIALILSRTLQENVAVTYDMAAKISRYIEEQNFCGITDLIENRTWGGREFPEMPKITNFMTAIDNTEKSFPGFKETYLILSEYAHPNYLGMGSLYGQLDKTKMEYTITPKHGVSEETLELMITAVIPCLIILELSLDEMIDQIHVLLSEKE